MGNWTKPNFYGKFTISNSFKDKIIHLFREITLNHNINVSDMVKKFLMECFIEVVDSCSQNICCQSVLVLINEKPT